MICVCVPSDVFFLLYSHWFLYFNASKTPDGIVNNPVYFIVMVHNFKFIEIGIFISDVHHKKPTTRYGKDNIYLQEHSKELYYITVCEKKKYLQYILTKKIFNLIIMLRYEKQQYYHLIYVCIRHPDFVRIADVTNASYLSFKVYL